MVHSVRCPPYDKQAQPNGPFRGEILMMRRRDLQRALSIAMGALLLLFCIPGQGEAPRSADSVADSVGVNIHLHFTDTIYSNFPLVQSLLTSLGVRHVRDGLLNT